MVVQAHQNPEFKKIIQSAELVMPDSAGIIWASEFVKRISPPHMRGSLPAGQAGKRGSFARVPITLFKFFFSNHQPLPGVDLMFDICEILEKKKGTVYLIGGKTHEVSDTQRVLQKKYTELRVLRLPPQHLVFSPSTPSVFPAAVFVALGSPKQSFWIEEHRDELERAGVKVAMGVGGAFAMISGTLPRAPIWMRLHHLEWLWRLILEPHRIKRIWNALVRFPYLVIHIDAGT